MSLRALFALALLLACLPAQANWIERVLGETPEAARALQLPVAHALGERASSPEEIVATARLLAGRRVRLLETGRSVTGRPLMHALVSSPRNLGRWESTAAAHRQLLEEGGTPPADLPVSVWFCMSVHGNELSGSEAGLALLRHLATATSAEVEQILEAVVLEIALDMNPDGRARAVAGQRDRQQWAGEDALGSFAHAEPWPGGRVNGHWFDLNRDWYLQTQPETRARLARLVAAPAQVIADFHEMGADDGYFAGTPAGPPDSLLAGPEVRSMLALLDRALQQSFDGAGRALWNADRFPSDYPGYGGAWGMFSGAAALTLEQASAGAGRARRSDGTVLPFEEACENHLRAAWALLGSAAASRGEMLRLFAAHGERVREEAARSERPDFIFAPLPDAGLLEYLASTLQQNGISVRRLQEACTLEVLALGMKASGSPAPEQRSFPAGSLVVKSVQGRGALVKALLEPDLPSDAAFERAEAERRSARARSERYDVSAWCLGLLGGVAGFRTAAVEASLLTPWAPSEKLAGTPDDSAVLWATRAAGVFAFRTHAELLAKGIRFRHVPFEFSAAGQVFPAGTLIALAERNREPALRAALAEAVRNGVLIPLRSAASASGHDPASWRTKALLEPDLVLLVGEGTNANSAGALGWLLHDLLALPVRRVAQPGLGRALEHATALILPDGSYPRGCGEKDVQAFLARGGVVVALGGAVTTLAGKEGPLADWKKQDRVDDFTSFNGLIVEGSILPEHWLAAGMQANLFWPLRGALQPLPAANGAQGRVVLEARRQVAGSQPGAGDVIQAKLPLVTDWPVERGRVVAFMGDPVARGMAPVAWELLVRALLLGPSEGR